MTTSSIARRLDALEAAAPAAQAPTLFILRPLMPHGVESPPLQRVRIGCNVFDRGADESEDAFCDRISAFRGPTMEFAVEVTS
jgi:hypothetical protein